MFFHNFKYTIKTLFKNKGLIFWTFAFPIILASFFYLAFSDLEEGEKLNIIDIAVVQNKEFNGNKIYKEALKTLSDKNSDERLFNIKYTNLEKAKKLLEDKKITGYLVLKEEPKIYISSNGINETVFKYAIEEINQNEQMISKLSVNETKKQMEKGNFSINYPQIYANIIEKISNSNANIKNISSANLSYTMVEYYTLIAMACLYGGILAMTAINQTLANMSSNGKRVSVSPMNKGKLILSSILASYLVQIIGLFLLFVYTIYILHVDYGDNILYTILLSLAGSLSGLSLALAVGSVLKSSEAAKTGIVLSITMVGCFLSGMMGMSLKYYIDKFAPLVNKFNPASMITDGFYSLYYYDTLNRYLFNLGSLIIFSIIMIIISYKSLRRQKYDSI